MPNAPQSGRDCRNQQPPLPPPCEPPPDDLGEHDQTAESGNGDPVPSEADGAASAKLPPNVKELKSQPLVLEYFLEVRLYTYREKEREREGEI